MPKAWVLTWWISMILLWVGVNLLALGPLWRFFGGVVEPVPGLRINDFV